jgi:hypothetical protein
MVDMRRLETQSEPTPTVGHRAATAVARDRGISAVTLWRWRSRNWIKSANISGKIYIDLESLADFDRRAAAGEFSKVPAGAAGVSSRVRAKKEKQKGGAE